MKFCFVGIGSIGKRHIRNLHFVCQERNIDCNIHVLRSTLKKLEEDIESLIDKEVNSYDSLDDFYDAVFITNPTYKHYDTLKRLLAKSNCFFVEKPVFDCTDIEIGCFLETNKKIYVACPLRYTSVLREAKRIIDKDKPISVRAITSSYLPDWRRNVDYRLTYSAHKDQGGGVRIDLIHEWDYLVSLFGYPEKVYCMEAKVSDLEIDSEDVAVYIARYEGLLVELHLDYFGRVTRRMLEVRTNNHEYLFDIAENRIVIDGEEAERFTEDDNDKYICEMRYFIDYCLNDIYNVNNLSKALKVLQITTDT